jgi:hypothetical protein
MYIHELTGEGVTLAGGDMVRVLEQILPARFGGNALDYQLEEVEDGQGFIRFNLLISPRVRLANEQAVIAEMMQSLRRSSVMADAARQVWQEAHTVTVKRAEPVWSERGKFLPIRKLKRA